MKFSDGFWMTRVGCDVQYAVQAYEVRHDAHSITVLAPCHEINDRGATVTGSILEITYSSYCKDIIKVTVQHYRGAKKQTPVFDLQENQGYLPEIEETPEFVQLATGSLRVVIAKTGGWNVQYYRGDEHLTGGAWRATSYIQDGSVVASQPNRRFYDPPERKQGSCYLREQLTLSVGECIYGFGEKFTPFVKNGQIVEMWNSDGGTCSEQSYKSIPFYLSSKGYGVFVNHPGDVSFEVASETVSKVSFAVCEEELEYFILGGETPADSIALYTSLTGKPALPPASSFGLWLSTSFSTSYDEETVMSFVDGMAERNIPLQVFHFDCFWMKEFEWCNFEWDKRQFPDPKGLIHRLNERGLEVCVWINPYVGQRSPLFDVGKEKGYFIKNPDGSVFQCDMWQPGLAIVDFTNPEARSWYASLIRGLLEMGVKYIKTDFGERIPSDVVYYSGEDPVRMHNYYSYLYNQTVFETLQEYYGKNQACLFARAATAGGQKFPVHWGGDCSAEYVSMAETLRGGLSLCASGFGFFSHDIGGFETKATPDLYKRWCAFGLMSSHSRLHGSTSYRVPWTFDDESNDVLRFFTCLKGRLMPYLYAQAVKTSTTGVPMMRAMVLDYSDDPACRYLDTQYMFGDDLLVAPVFDPSGEVTFYLPEGCWTDIITGEAVQGGGYVTRKCSYLEMPILARPNSIVAYGAFERDFVYDYLQDTEFVIYELGKGASARTSVYDADASLLVTLEAYREGNTISLTHTPTDKHFTVTVAGTNLRCSSEEFTNGCLTLTIE